MPRSTHVAAHVPLARAVLAIGLSIGLSFAAAVSSSAAEPHATASHAATSAVAAQDSSRDLWLGHIFHVREVVRSVLAKDPAGMQAAEQAAVQNARAIAQSIEPFYGAAARDRLFELLAGHYGAVKGHASALVVQDAAEAAKQQNQLVANANEISAFLSKANPHLPEAAVKGLLLAHGGHHLQQNQQLARREYAAELRTWEEMKGHVYTIADALTGALAKQFPEKF